GLAAHQGERAPDQRVGAPGQRGQDLAQHLDHREQDQDQTGRALPGHRLRDHLAEDEHQRGEGDRDQEGRAPAHHRDERPGRHAGGGDVGDGDAHHGGGQESLRAAERLQVADGGPVPALRHVPQADPVRRDERHLGRGEERGHQQGEADDPDVDHVASRVSATSGRATITSSTRVRSTFSTDTRTPSSVSFFSPRWGTRPNRSSTQPPTVSKESSGITSPAVLFSSWMGRRPETRKVRGPTRWIRRSSSSYSSRISPTSSSSRSSRVTRPAVPPYSSTTMARWSFLAWNSRSRASARFDSGTK